MAGEYHENDFDVSEIADEAHGVLSQQAELAAQLHTSKVTDFPAANWEEFHATHNSAKFFKERRYICLAFPELLQQNAHILEIGCGHGSSIVPVLKANPTCTASVCDVSRTAIANLQSTLQSLGIDSQRVHVAVHDAASATECRPICQSPADTCMLIFTLSAVPPDEMHVMLEKAFQSLRPGGKLLIRDYGRYDMVSLRFPAAQRIDDGLYYRSDARTGTGTLAYFFSTAELQGACCAAGFECSHVKYACVKLVNKRKQKEMNRVFVQGIFTKPR